MERIFITAELKGHFLRLYQIALSDEDFSPAEMQLLYRFAEEREISKLELDKILTDSVGEVTIPESLEKRIAYLYDLALMIWADKKITPDEMNTLKKYIQKFDFLDENVDELCDYLLESAQQEKTKQDILAELNE
ncbi:hypothetical protein ABV409_02215 [Flagellimonas sp. DF-77]|uniref:hypothetical protein n=1 Tax=Flagellimonas algarum TaxID=3230298 RepID=UPI0033984626